MRLSAINPNMQNIPRDGNIKSYFVSRFKEGRLVQADFSQLEVVVQGWHSEDAKFKQDIMNGTDFHVLRLSWASEALLGTARTYEEILKEKDTTYKAARTQAKGITFQRAFGAGAASIAVSTGVPEDVVALMIEAEELMYPNISKKNEAVLAYAKRNLSKNIHKIQLLDKNKKPLTDKMGKPYPEVDGRTGLWKTPFGTILGFPQKQKFNTKEVSFKPTYIKNYPVQHSAFLIVMLTGIIVYKWLVDNNFFDNKILPINTVHDSYIFDCADEEHVKIICEKLKKVVASLPEVLYRRFNINWDLPLGIDCEYGINLKDLNKWK
jgi:DNA polymerase I-like protein with 3'-5' exonuclease and polymerase domains